MSQYNFVHHKNHMQWSRIESRLQRLRKLACILLSSNRAVNTLRLGYKTSELILHREIIAVCSDPYETLKYGT
jgi:hypothetical protein